MANLNPEILITAKDEASKVLKNLGNEAEKTGQSFKETLQKNITGLTAGFAAVTAVIGTSIKAFSDSQNAISQLDAVLKSTKNAVGLTSVELQKMASALQQQSRFDDEAIIGAQSLLLTFTKIGKDVFPDATQTVLDMSQALGQDLKSSSIQLGKALNDPIQGVTALRRVGVSFNEQQLEQIKTMQQSGDLMGAQKLILKELATEFGGSASASAKTFAGQIDILKNNFNDLQETLGKGLLDTLSQLTGGNGFEGLNKAILNFNKMLQENKLVLSLVVGALVGIAVVLGGLLLFALIAAAGAAAGFVAVFALVAAGVTSAAILIMNYWEPISKFFSDLWNGIVNTIKVAIDLIKNYVVNSFNNMISPIVNAWKAIAQGVISALNWLYENVRNIIGAIVNFLKMTNPVFRIAVEIPNIANFIRDRFNDARKMLPKSLQGLIPQFATGGIVGGAIGQPQLAMVHGGEEIVPYRGGQKSSGGGNLTLNVSIGMYAGTEVEKRRIAEELHRALKVSAGAQNKTVAELYT